MKIVILCDSGKISDVDDELIELTLDPCENKTGDIWHICIEVFYLVRFLIFVFPTLLSFINIIKPIVGMVFPLFSLFKSQY